MLVSNFSSAALGLLISILIARNAGVAALGAYSLALAWSLTLAQFADLGMNTLLTRDLARAPRLTASYVTASLISKTVLGLALTLTLILVAPALTVPGEGTRALQLGAGIILLNAWYGTFTAVLRAFGRMLPILILNASGIALQTVGTHLLVQRGADVQALVALAVSIQGAQLVGAWVTYVRQKRAQSQIPPEFQFNLAYTWRLTRAALPFAIAGILASLELRANVFLLGAIQGERAVGWYSAASRLNEGIRLAPNAFFGAMLPALAMLCAHRGAAHLRAYFRRREIALLGFGAGAALFLSVAAAWLITFLYGETFLPAVPVLILMGWGLIPALWIGLLTLFLYAQQQEHSVNRLLALGLVLQVVLAVILIAPFGAPGAVGAALVSDLVVGVLMRHRVAQFLRVPDPR